LVAAAQDLVELLELGDPDRRLEVGPPVVEAEPDVVEPAAVVVCATLVPQAAELPPLLLGVRGDDTAFTGRDQLVRVEGEDGRRPVRPDRRAPVLGAERLA